MDRRCYRLKTNYEERERERTAATFWLQEPRDVKGIMSNAESLLQILPHGVFQRLLHVHQAGVDGLDHSQESQPAPPAACKVLHCHAIPEGKQQLRQACKQTQGCLADLRVGPGAADLARTRCRGP